MQGGYVPIALYLDAKSVYAATIATFVKQPSEKSLLCHVQYLRELLDKDVLRALFWIDTRDMGADGLTKGAVARVLLHMYMHGYMPLEHDYEQGEARCHRRPVEANRLKLVLPCTCVVYLVTQHTIYHPQPSFLLEQPLSPKPRGRSACRARST